MKYTLSQYVHDSLRLRLIDEEKSEIHMLSGHYTWTDVRLKELAEERAMIEKRMALFEKHAHNR